MSVAARIAARIAEHAHQRITPAHYIGPIMHRLALVLDNLVPLKYLAYASDVEMRHRRLACSAYARINAST